MRATPLAVCLLILFTASGCPVWRQPSVEVPAESSPPRDAPSMSGEPLRDLVARTLSDNLRGRRLDTETNAAWQILHGLLAYGDELIVQTPEGPRNAKPLLLSGEPVRGFQLRPADTFSGRVGLRGGLQPNSKIGQGHRDQWLAIFAQSGVTLETEIIAAGERHTIADWVRQAEFDVPRNLESEYSWTLIALSSLHPTDHQWEARDGEVYATEDLLAAELAQEIPTSACGGTHRLVGIAMAVQRRRDEGKALDGLWAEAESRLSEWVERARRFQNPDGSFSSAYLERPGWSRDLSHSLATSGHVLEFLAFAAPRETLAEAWLERGVRQLCETLETCRKVDLECGTLYHALHGLQTYQERRWGDISASAW